MPNIKIRIERGVQTAGDGQEIQENANKTSPKKIALVSAFAHQTLNTGKQIISYSSSNVGNFTGNNVLQDQINNNLEILGYVTNIATGVATSVSTWNPIPAIASIASVGFSIGTKVYSRVQEERHGDVKVNFLINRSGNLTKNGSRGTEY